jgi:YD repeat-containing protein
VASRTENNAVTYYAYTGRGELARVWGDTYPLQYEYYDNGRLEKLHTYQTAPSSPTTLPWPTGSVTTWAYHDHTGALQSKTDAANKSVAYAYNNAGRLSTRTWARGGVTTYSYDLQGQLTGIAYNDSNTPDVTWSIPDEKGRYTRLVDGAGTHTLTYDDNGTITADTLASGGLSETSASAWL